MSSVSAVRRICTAAVALAFFACSSTPIDVAAPAPERAARPSGYRLPPQEVIDIVDAPPTPSVSLSPGGERMVLAHRSALPSIEELARPLLRIGGLRIDPGRNERQQRGFNTRFEIETIADGRTVAVRTPPDARLGSPQWSPDGERIAFTNTTDQGVELWVADARTGRARRLVEARLNATYGDAATWNRGSRRLLVRLVSRGRGPEPEAPSVPDGPIVTDTEGRAAMNRTYQDLLADRHDEDLLDHYLTAQLAQVELDGGVTEIGPPGIYSQASASPDGRFLLVDRVQRPYSYSVPVYRFSHALEVWDVHGRVVQRIAELPVADEVPIGGVPTGPRGVDWRPGWPATLFWVEALDGGDPDVEVDHRDALFALAAPFDGGPLEIARTRERFQGADWTDDPDLVLVSEYDRDRRWTTTTLRDLRRPEAGPMVIDDRSRNDRYGDPGDPVRHELAGGERVVLIEDGWIYLDGAGASPEGERPFLDRLHLASGKKERLFRSPPERHTSFAGFAGEGPPGKRPFVVRRESAGEPPNYFLHDPGSGAYRALTAFPDPHPQLTGIAKEVVTYARADGVPLSGTLYLPPGHEPGTRLPLVVWAYPIEYNDASTAGQVRATTNRFTRLSSTSPLMFLTQGYAVLDGAAMPVVGDPETMNDTFVEQMVSSAAAAIEAMAERGVADPHRVGVGGHSYGAFMTANLLAHSDLFRAGIARSGAYNRSLTPFGFQSERRTAWEATDAYVAVSPFFHADEIDEPILLIHGEIDGNSGTFPIQSQRLFHALQGLGGTARLVLLPHESHGYAARESVLHVLAESFDWFERYVKDAEAPPEG